MSNTTHKDALTAEQINQKAIDFADGRERRGCAYWYGLRDGYKAAMEEYASLQQSKGHDLEPGVQSPDSASVASHSCTETSLLSNMIAVANSMQREHNKWRYGQCLFNALNELSPSMANQLRATKYDCFYREDLIGQFIVKVEEMASSVLNVQRSVATEGDSSTGDDNLK
jgi:hypothetical protein